MKTIISAITMSIICMIWTQLHQQKRNFIGLTSVVDGDNEEKMKEKSFCNLMLYVGGRLHYNIGFCLTDNP